MILICVLAQGRAFNLPANLAAFTYNTAASQRPPCTANLATFAPLSCLCLTSPNRTASLACTPQIFISVSSPTHHPCRLCLLNSTRFSPHFTPKLETGKRHIINPTASVTAFIKIVSGPGQPAQAAHP